MVVPSKTVLVTGCAGFIGAALVEKLLKFGMNVIGIDDLNSYYETKLKLDRLEKILSFELVKLISQSKIFFSTSIPN